jgi:hypothetical protein
MGRLIMSFRGLCIHVKKGAWLTAPNVGHRVVAIDASHGTPQTAWPPLPAHFCFIEAHLGLLHALEREGLPQFLDGWNLQVMNAIGPALDICLEDTPNLTQFSPGMVLRKDLGEAGAPSKAACFVDMQFGTVTISRFVITDDPAKGGVYTVWTVETNGDPELRFVSRNGKVVTITIPSTPEGAVQSNGVPGSLVLHNSTTDLTDKNFDFVLNYLASETGIPNTLTKGFPGQDPGQDPQPMGPNVGMGTSCSNSAYP